EAGVAGARLVGVALRKRWRWQAPRHALAPLALAQHQKAGGWVGRSHRQAAQAHCLSLLQRGGEAIQPYHANRAVDIAMGASDRIEKARTKFHAPHPAGFSLEH